MKSKTKTSKRKSVLTLLLLAVLAYVFYLAGQGNLPKKAESSSTKLSASETARIQEEAKRRAQASFESETIVIAKRAVLGLLKDPESAKFKDVRFNETESGGAVACGLVNSKNSFGAFSGFQRFISNGKTTFLEEQDKNIADTWAEVCIPSR